MIPELEKPRITEIRVRIDCNGCVQKIKKALHGINGIYDIYIDFTQQKLTIIGWADPERIIKAIKKTRKIATICSHTEATDSTSKPREQAPDQTSTPAPDGSNASSTEPPLQELAPSTEPPKDTPPPPENPQPTDPTPPPVAKDPNAGPPAHPVGPKDVGEVHVIYHHQHDYGYRYAAAPYDYAPGFRFQNSNSGVQYVPQPPPVSVTHSYNTYKPSPYVTEYEYVRTPSQNRPSPYSEYDHVHSPPSHVYYSRMQDRYDGSSNNGNITSIFSDENPNACRIV